MNTFLTYKKIEDNIFKKVAKYDLSNIIYTAYDNFIENNNLFNLPVSIGVKILDECNLNCVYCSNEHDKLNCIKPSNEKLLHNDYLELFNYISEHGIMSHITGGEPFINKNIIKYIEILSQTNTPYKVFSNATLLDDNIIDSLYNTTKNSNFSLQISLDGPEDVYNELVGSKKNIFPKVYENILKLVKKGFYIKINCVISKYNYKYQKDIIDICNQLGVNELSFTPVFVTPNNQDLQADDVLVANEFIKAMDHYNLNHYTFVISQTPIACLPNLGNIDFVGKCPACISTCEINEYGDVIPCPYLNISNFNMGNIKKYTIEQIWNNEKVKEFRNRAHVVHNCNGNKCNGICPASSFYAFGDLNQCDMRCSKAKLKMNKEINYANI